MITLLIVLLIIWFLCGILGTMNLYYGQKHKYYIEYVKRNKRHTSYYIEFYLHKELKDLFPLLYFTFMAGLLILIFSIEEMGHIYYFKIPKNE